MLRETASKSDLGYTHRGKVNTWRIRIEYYSRPVQTRAFGGRSADSPANACSAETSAAALGVTRLKTVIITAGK